MMLTQKPLPQKVRLSIIVGAVFVFWVMFDSILTPVKHHMWADPELLNATGAYTIPACFFVIVYFIVRHYGNSPQLNTGSDVSNT